ncbi:MAG: hypothetical protein ACD_51C00341G0002 [uncultured bacterium]|nr:MAG: hypothetical protein ACD_51C00341G0002 [uncultured bacterium]OGJ47602.1 MAG: hypothetical protein A2244_00875 [Candidatus Peregrinibacteria bacterium RIFOXYA2_FULL_41_18]OGJ49597.1 MAG: hypothetical protein A2344_02235 [Candidatus Peregrinibacteria bacterium RIFOXYB12_FULL_41_12]OGJ52817.1 MAG: hypothetical protein A2336_03480 [Candidatus Peregrinibacteria bacterium RIFOXYB2_FULL_41_88]OGJ53041.1 MAG: hypothetical protein A2448_01200 [Candidatus Peregrinibacteria bacterium RIFOXYC2_FULL
MLKIEKLLRTAVKYMASDLFLTAGAKPTLRINGDLVAVKEHPVVTPQMAEEYILEILSPAQRAIFDEGNDLDFSFEIAEVSHFRVNIFRQKNGMGSSFRVISSKIPKLEELGLPEQLKTLTDLPHGLILITGPSGSGKSTTLASLLNEINEKYSKHILTIEDPIEYVYTNNKSVIDQREVKTHCKSFTSALKSSLRENPDVIMVGELRDLETISLAITAAETGHLVMGTLHTSGAAKTVNRIIDIFPHDQQEQIRTQLAESMQAIIWQRLVKSSDGKSRLPALEIMLNNPAVANLIRKGQTHQLNNVIETSRKQGMQTMKRALLELAAANKITKEEAMRFLPMELEE